MKTLIMSGIAAAFLLGTAASAGTIFDYSGTGGFSDEAGTYDTYGTIQLSTLDFNQSITVYPADIEDSPQDRPATPSPLNPGAMLWPMIDWSTDYVNLPEFPANEPPANGKSALGLVEYYNGANEGAYVAQVEADSGMLVPVGAVTHYNITVTSWGIVKAEIVWTVKIWPQGGSAGSPLLEVTEKYPFLEWETYNGFNANPHEPLTYDTTLNTTITPTTACPRSFLGNMTDPWISETWVGDGNNMTVCDDAMRYTGAGGTSPIGTFDYDGSKYSASLSGFYDCNDSAGIYQPLTDCKLANTFWDPEYQNNTAYVMLSIHKMPGTEGCTPGYWGNSSHNTALGHNWPAPYVPSMTIETAFGLSGSGSSDQLCVAKNCKKDPSSLLSIYDVTLGQAIKSPGGTIGQLAFHGTAALLNAASIDYFASVATVKEMFACGIGDDSVTAAECETLGYTKGDAKAVFTQFATWNENGMCVLDNSDNGGN
jgi:hypothetical protein